MTRPTVLVLWTGYPAGAGAVRALRRSGFRVVGAFQENRSGGRSAACLAPRRYPSAVSDPDAFLSSVRELCRRERVDVVLPLDEDIVRVLADRGAELGDVPIVGPDARQYRTLCDKVRLTETARSIGLPTPETVLVTAAGPEGPWPPLPSIVKPQTSRSDTARPMAVATAQERDEYVAELVAGGHSAVVQERVIGQRWVVQSVRGRDSFEYVPLRVDQEWPRGAGLASLKTAGDEPPGLVESAAALLGAVDYVGPSGISFIERGGAFYPHDANLRLGATSGASLQAGFEFQRRAVEVTLGLPGPRFSGPPRRTSYMRLDLEVEALVDAVRRRRSDASPLSVLRGIARVALSRHGRLDPSPLNPFWLSTLLLPRIRRNPIRLRRRRSSKPTAVEMNGVGDAATRNRVSV